MPSGMKMVHVLASYEVSQWMLFECLFRHENGTCIGYEDEVVSQWMCYSNAFFGHEDEVVVTQWVFPFDCLRA